MTSVALGSIISAAEVTHVSRDGFWILLQDEELFVSFLEFPWFRDASIGKLMNVEWPQSNHLYWPDLDIDLSVDSIRNPAAFPLSAKG